MKSKKQQKIDPRFLQKYLESHGSLADQQQIGEWASDLMAGEELRKLSRDRWNEIPADSAPSDYDESRLHDKIHHILRLEDAASAQEAKSKLRWLTTLTRIAAVLFLPLALFSLLNWGGITEKSQSESYAEIFSPQGARTSFVLPDGSSGWLNGGSSLKFQTKFKERTLNLNGEGYFVVLKDPKNPFTVVADETRVKAYGTSFNVMAYPEDQNTEITLETGVIEVFTLDEREREESLNLMSPGENLVVENGTRNYLKEEVNVDKYTSWKEGKLVFRNEPMTRVVKKMNRWYNVNIVIKDSRVESYVYRATFVDETLDEVLKIFERTSPIAYEKLERERLPDGTYDKSTIHLYYRTNKN